MSIQKKKALIAPEVNDLLVHMKTGLLYNVTVVHPTDNATYVTVKQPGVERTTTYGLEALWSLYRDKS